MKIIFLLILSITTVLFSTTGIVLSIDEFQDQAEFLFEKLGYDTVSLRDPRPSMFRLAIMGSALENETVIVLASGKGRAFNGRIFVDLGGGEFDLTSFVKGLSASSSKYVFLMCLEGRGEKNEAYAMRFTLGNTYPPKNVSLVVLWGKNSLETLLGAIFGYASEGSKVSLKDVVEYSKEKVEFVRWRGKVDFEFESLFSKMVKALVNVHGKVSEDVYRRFVEEVYSFPRADVSTLEKLLKGKFKIEKIEKKIDLRYEIISFGEEGKDRIYSIANGDGFRIAVGYTDSNVCERRGGFDLWILKLSENLKLLSSECLGGEGDDRGYSAQKVSDGFLVLGRTSSRGGDVSGWHRGYENGKATYDAWILKIDDRGNVEWSVVMGGSGNDLAFSSLELKDSYLIAGWTSSHDGDFPYTLGESDFFVVKLSKDGDVVWKRTFGTPDAEGEDRLSPVILKLDGRFAIVGRGRGRSYIFEFDRGGFPKGRKIVDGLEITDALVDDGRIFFVAEKEDESVFGKIEDGDVRALKILKRGDKLKLKHIEKRGDLFLLSGWVLRGRNVDIFLALVDGNGRVVAEKNVGGSRTDLVISGEDGILVGWSYSRDWIENGGESDGIVLKIEW